MRRQICALVLVAAAGLAGIAGPAAAQPIGSVAGLRADLAQLKDRAERRFQVVPLRRGLMLVPTSDAARVRSIEIADGQVIVDGTPVTGRELRDRIGDDADLVGRLSFLDAAARRQMFPDAPASTRPAEPPAPPALPPVPDVPATPVAPVRPADTGWNETARSRRGGARFRLGGDVSVREGEAVGSDVVVVLGSAHVEGRVDGDVVAVGGSVYLGPKADVQGSVTSVGGQVARAEGAKVNGEINEVHVSAPSVGPFVRVRPWPSGRGSGVRSGRRPTSSVPSSGWGLWGCLPRCWLPWCRGRCAAWPTGSRSNPGARAWWAWPPSCCSCHCSC